MIAKIGPIEPRIVPIKLKAVKSPVIGIKIIETIKIIILNKYFFICFKKFNIFLYNKKYFFYKDI
jgi:hypothetical protein